MMIRFEFLRQRPQTNRSCKHTWLLLYDIEQRLRVSTLNETLSNIKSTRQNGSFIVCNNRAHITARKEKKEKKYSGKDRTPG